MFILRKKTCLNKALDRLFGRTAAPLDFSTCHDKILEKQERMIKT
jgi:hypothetical protein